jgi:hypothetical protein
MITRKSVWLSALALCACVGVGLVACGERFEAGLANAPSLERKTEPRSQNDVIAVGEEGCESRDGGATVASGTMGCRQNLATARVEDAGAPALSR